MAMLAFTSPAGAKSYLADAVCTNPIAHITMQDVWVGHADYSYLNDSLKQGLVGHVDIDMALLRVLTQRFKLGMFDPPEQQPWSTIPMDVVGSQRHLEAAVEAVRRGDHKSSSARL